jgi:hypothetical protein
MLAAGVIVRWHAAHTTPPKMKRFICCCPARGWFLMINTRNVWGHSLLLPAACAGGGLDYDSYVELAAVVERRPADLAAAVASGQAALIGRLDRWGLRQLQAAVGLADTLADRERAVIEQAIAEALTDP